MSDDLVARLRHAWDERERQLAEDERLVLKAKKMRYELPTDAPWEQERLIAEHVGGNSSAVAVHRMVAVFANPARVLAEVERGRRDIAAKRRILDEYEQAQAYYEQHRAAPAGEVAGLWTAVRALAEAEGLT